MVLEQELETYKKNLPEWSEHHGQYVLIHGDEVVEFYKAYEDALKIGYSRFGLKPFLIKQVAVVEQAHFISRHFDPYASGVAR